MQIRKYIPFIFTILLLSISILSQAQCAMCKGTVQTSQYAKSINNGIEYLLMAPILLVGIIIFLWVKNKEKFQTKEN
jgi:hypothetical protein